MSIFKLSKPAWKLTDEEYVEHARTVLKWNKRLSRAGSILWLLIVLGMFAFTLRAVGVALDHPSGPETSLMTLAYLLGGLAGGMMGYTLMKAVVLVGETWAMERTYRILLASWDRMKELEGLNEPSASTELNPPQP